MRKIISLVAFVGAALAGFSQTTTAQTAPSGSLVLTWTSNSNSQETAFIVQRSNDGQSWSDVGRTGKNVTTYTDLPPLPVVAELSYRVRAIDEVNNLTSEYCAAATIKLVPKPTPTPTPKPKTLAKPTNLRGAVTP